MEHLICPARHGLLFSRCADRAKAPLVEKAPVPPRIVFRVAITAALMLVATATTAQAADDAAGVMPSTLPALRPELEPAAERLYNALMRQAHYLLGTVRKWDKEPSMKLLTDSKSAEHWIRPNTSTLVGLAVLRRWGPYDAKVVGVSRESLL
ncbi:MAG: hypothetical protein ACYTG0_29425, partial [Planctomycetota bacterium]